MAGMGSIVLSLDVGKCEAMFISSTAKKLYTCNSNYNWTEFNVLANFPIGIKTFVPIDPSLF